MASATVAPLNKTSQEAFVQYYKSLQDLQTITRTDLRTRFERIDRDYQRELDLTSEESNAAAAVAKGDPTKFQNMTVPIVMPQVEAAVTHQAKVFLSEPTIFDVISAPEFMDEALQMNTLIDAQSVRGGWAKELLTFFRNGFKYNYAPIEIAWNQEVTYTPETDIATNPTEATLKEVIWSGNKLTTWDPYNTFLDTRVPASEMHIRGEFAGRTRVMSRIELKMFIAALPDKITANIRPAFESGVNAQANTASSDSQSFYLPNINPMISHDYDAQGINWLKWVGLQNARDGGIDYKNAYEVTTVYMRVLPSEFSLKIKKSNTPQIYKLHIVNHEHIIYAELQTNAHNYIPVLVGQPLEDGLSYQTKSLATNGSDFQALATAYMNSIIASRRRAISDRTLYDPSRVTEAAINSENPSAKIPVRQSAYGKSVSDAVYAFPYREDQAVDSMQQIQGIVQLSNQLTGQNPVSQGQHIKGNKTDSQFDAVMDNSTGRDVMAAILLEHQVFVPMKEIIKLNILQYEGGGTIHNRDKQVAVEIDPVALRKAVLNFKISDGLIPSEQVLPADSFTVAMQTVATNPAIGSGYNITPMFSYLMKSQGADLTAFEKSSEQIAFEQAMAAWSQAMQMAMEKGINPETIGPQPVPEQFGYVPAETSPGDARENEGAQAANAEFTQN